MGLTDVFRGFQRIPKIFAGDGPAAATPLKFGTHAPRVTLEQARMLQKLSDDVARMLVMANTTAFDVMTAIEDGEIRAEEEVYFAFADCQERLNQILIDRSPLRTTVEIGFDVARRLTSQAVLLRRCGTA